MPPSSAPLTAAAAFLFLALLVASVQFTFWGVISGVSMVIAIVCGAIALRQHRSAGH